MFKKDIDSSAPINELIANRWSGLSFDAGRAVSDDDLLSLLEAARWAPSCFGDQPWRFIVCNKNRNPDAWQKLFDCLGEKNQAWCANVPVLISVCHDTQFSQNGNPNGLAAYDTGAASVSLCLQAAALGIMTHQMAGFSADLLREKFAVPERYKPIAVIAVGYQLPENQLIKDFNERELAPRKRNELGRNFFMGAWQEEE